MSFIAYVLMFIGIVVILAIGGMICESESFADRINKVKRGLSIAAQIAVYALMLPAMIVCRIALAFGFSDRERA